MNRIRVTWGPPRRVYYTALALLGLLLAAGVTRPGAQGREPVEVSIEPMMTKGPATAPVVIIEFSDYQ